MRNKLIPLFALLFLCASRPGIAQTSLSMGTYHTAPYGSYSRLRLVPRAGDINIANACDMTTIGLMYIEKPTGEEKSIPRFCTIVNDAGQWSLITGVWDADGTDIFPKNTSDPFVGIGTDTPASRLHISGGPGYADFLIDADIDDDEADAKPTLTLTQGSTYVAKLGFLGGSENLILSSDTGSETGRIRLHSAGGFIKFKDTEGNAIGDAYPDALFEVSQSGAEVIWNDTLKNVFHISSDSEDDNFGNILYVEHVKSGSDVMKKRIGIGDNDPGAPLNIRKDEAGGFYSVLRVGGLLDGPTADFTYNGGEDGVFDLVHFGDTTTGTLQFIAQHLDFTAAELTNTGTFYVPYKVEIEGEIDDSPEEAELFITDETWDPEAADHSALDMFWMLSDEGTNTGVDSPSGCTYLKNDTIGMITSADSQTETTLSSGLTIIGLSDPSIIPMNLNGIRDTGQTQTPAVVFDGVKDNALGEFAPAQGGEITLRSSYWSSSGISFLSILGDGRVGIGMNAGNPMPTQEMHVRNVIRLTPVEDAPECDNTDGSDEEGTLYADDDGALCYCDGTDWQKVAGPGNCI